MPRTPERSSVAVMTIVASCPSCTCGGTNSIETSCGGVVSEFGSFVASRSRRSLLPDGVEERANDPVETLAGAVFVDGAMAEVPPGGLGATEVGLAIVAVVAVVRVGIGIGAGDDALARIW